MANTKLAAMLDTREETKAATIPQGQRYEVGQYLPIASIRMDGGTQARAGLDEATVTEYAEAWLHLSHRQNGFLEMPPIVVFHDGSSYWLADGFHRVVAYRQFLDSGSAGASPRAIRAAIEQGTQRDAILYACGANDKHGLRRSSADKRRAAATLLRDTEWGQWSDSEIGRRVNVDHKTIASVRAELVATGEIPGSAIRQSADGKLRDVTGISESNTRRAAPARSFEQALLPDMPAPAYVDLPPEYAIVQRRLAAHGVELLSNMQGRERAFVIRKAGGTGVITFDWQDVLNRLSLLEDGMEAPTGEPARSDVAPTRLICPTCGEAILNGIWGDLKECGSCYHTRQKAEAQAASAPAQPSTDAPIAAVPAERPEEQIEAGETKPAYWHGATCERFANTATLARWCAARADHLTADARITLAEETNQLIVELETLIEALT